MTFTGRLLTACWMLPYLHDMPSAETEWSLQRRLTARWLERGVVILGGERFFLAAWEVMTNFKINDARRHWNRPSIDFVLLDRTGRLALVELKREVGTPREGWSVLCQVTHRAQVLAAGFSHSRLEEAYFDCYTGTDGRTTGATDVEPVVRAHARTFGQPPLDNVPGLPVRRFVMAKEFAPTFAPILTSMNSDSRQALTTSLGRYKARGEIKRYLELPPDLHVGSSPIQAVTVDGLTWPGTGA